MLEVDDSLSMMDTAPLSADQNQIAISHPAINAIVSVADFLDGDEQSLYYQNNLAESGLLTLEIKELGSQYGFDKVVTVGNSGLLLTKQNDIWVQHFMPDKQAERSEENSIKYSALYAASILKVCMWAEKRPDLAYLYGVSNVEMGRYRERLLDRHYSVLSTVGIREYPVYVINLKALATDNNILARLKKYSERIQRQNVTMNYSDNPESSYN